MELFFIFLLVSVSIVWLGTMRARDSARAAVTRLCKQHNLQLLDQSVALASMRISRATSGGLTLRRLFRFDYTETGNTRENGSIWIRGDRAELISIKHGDNQTIEWVSNKHSE